MFRRIPSNAVAPGATLVVVASQAKKFERTFKTAWFTKAARKSQVSDKELCEAIQRVMRSRGDDLGGGVFKARLSKNQYRSIILASAGDYWVYEYLFAKQDRANIADDEKDWMEICHSNQTQN